MSTLPTLFCTALRSAVLVVITAFPAVAAVYHVDPSAASGGDGSPGRPWPSIGAALKDGTVRGGDEILLAAGDYGDLEIKNAKFDTPVRIASDGSGTVRASRLRVTASRNLVVEGFSVWPDGPVPPKGSGIPGLGPLVKADAKSSGIVLRGLDIRGAVDAENYIRWTEADWQDAHRAGVMLDGPDNTLEASRITGTSFAIATTGARDQVIDNVVSGFSGDAMRALGDDSFYSGNRVQDCVQIDNNHADAFQSWSIGKDRKVGAGVVDGLHLEGNVIMEWASSEVSPLRCHLQGIGLFDGMYSNVVVRNNVIATSAYHGINVGGGLGVTIENNTLVNLVDPGAKWPWINVSPHRNGTPSRDVLVANNITPKITIDKKTEGKTETFSNLVGPYPARYLEAPYAGDFRPKAGSAPLGAGDPDFATPNDIDGAKRPTRPSIGAYERP